MIDEERWRHWKPINEKKCLAVYVIYERPLDYPDRFVVRRWRVVGAIPTAEKALMTADSLEEARTCVPPGLLRFEGSKLIEEACIVESWL